MSGLSKIGSAALRRFALPSRTAIRRSSGHGHHAEYTAPGENLPFDISNPIKLTVYFALYFGSAFAVPFLAVRHQLLK